MRVWYSISENGTVHKITSDKDRVPLNAEQVFEGEWVSFAHDLEKLKTLERQGVMISIELEDFSYETPRDADEKIAYLLRAANRVLQTHKDSLVDPDAIAMLEHAVSNFGSEEEEDENEKDNL